MNIKYSKNNRDEKEIYYCLSCLPCLYDKPIEIQIEKTENHEYMAYFIKPTKSEKIEIAAIIIDVLAHLVRYRINASKSWNEINNDNISMLLIDGLLRLIQ